jgi:hypothetical protein
LISDTSISDIWFVEPSYTCRNQTNGAVLNQSACNFGPGLSPSDNFQQIPDVNLNATYGATPTQGANVGGILAYETLSLAGLNITQQEVGYGTQLYWAGVGDGTSSGLIGMAFRNLTNQYPGTDPSADVPADLEHYTPIMETIFFRDNLTAPYFSVELSRAGRNATSAFGGYVEFGAAPDLSQPGWASAPLLPISGSSTEFLWYNINIDGIVDGGALHPANATSTFLVDTASTLLYLPATDAARINALFDPPAQFVDGAYVVDCNATAPQGVGLRIGGVTFPIDPEDLINLQPFEQGICATGVQEADPTEDNLYLIGDVFLFNVLAVFDLEHLQIHFHAL